MAALELRERLGIEVVVIEGNFPLADDEPAAVPPSGELGNEVRGRGELDVHRELFFQARDGPIENVIFRNHLDVEADGAGAPAEENRGDATGEVDTGFDLGFGSESPDELAYPRLVYRPTHSAASSKLTRRRMRAL